MLNSESSIFSKSKKEIYEDYVKKFQLEKLISEMTNSLVHSQASNPIIYMIKYLTGLLSEEDKIKNNINIPPPYPQGVPIVRFPKFKNKNILSKYLTRDNWSYIKRKKTLYNNNINDITKLLVVVLLMMMLFILFKIFLMILFVIFIQLIKIIFIILILILIHLMK